ncbi:MAG TPA: hypothetical protein ENI15_00570 [Spirochaetes bacterium]|nr:hypothetical protein [Spirochaetota bacterium]
MTFIEEKRCKFWGKNPILKGLRIAGMVVFGIIAAAIFALVFGYFVMLLWNWLMPLLFGLTVITYWQAFGILILAKLIFGAVGRGGRPHGHGHWKKWGLYDEWNMKNGPGRWKYHHDFWRDEGKEAFDNYIKKRESEVNMSEDEQKIDSN